MTWPGFSNLPAAPWFAAGLAFECFSCGRCCAGPGEGYVWVTDREIADIAAFLGTTSEEIRRMYVRRVGGGLSLVERPGNHDCVFLSPPAEGGSRGCRIYSARPRQCRNWPFWAGNLSSPEDWSRAARRCQGVNRGKKFSAEEINERMRAPSDEA
jgi:uncharacterized protein